MGNVAVDASHRAMEIHLLDQLDNSRLPNLRSRPLMQKLSALFDLEHVHPTNCLPPIECCKISPHSLDMFSVCLKSIMELEWPWIHGAA
jgi:hypothetical protein